MSTLIEHLKGKSKKDFAERIGVSGGYLTQVMQGKRNPSIEVAEKIAVETGGAVPISSWPHHAAVLDAARRLGEPAQGA